MPPYPISVIDDSDDFVDLPRGHIGGRATAMTSNRFKGRSESGDRFETSTLGQPMAYIHDSQGRRSHSLTRAADSIHDFASAIDTNSEVGGEPALPTQPTLAKSSAALINPDGKQREKKGKAKKVAFEDEVGANHAEEDDFFFGDMGKKEAFGNMMGKTKKVQNTGKLLSPDGKYKLELHRVDGDETHSLLESAIDDSNEIMESITGLQANRPQAKGKQPARLEERSVTPAQSSGRVAQNTQQQDGIKERPTSTARASTNATSTRPPSDELRRQAIHHNATLADHIGGIPVMTRPPRPADVLVAHELNDEERQAIEPARPVRIPLKYVRQPPPRFGFLILHRNGDIGLVHDKGPALINRGVEQRRTWSYSRERTNSPGDSRRFLPGPAHAPASTNGPGPVRIPASICAPAAVHTSVSARAPASVCAPAPVRAPAPAPASAATSNYHAPTVESASDTGDLAGLFG